MKAKPSIQRARVATELLIRHPRGMTELQIRRLLAPATDDQVRELLDGMLLKGTIARVEIPRPDRKAPRVFYHATARIREAETSEGQGGAS